MGRRSKKKRNPNSKQSQERRLNHAHTYSGMMIKRTGKAKWAVCIFQDIRADGSWEFPAPTRWYLVDIPTWCHTPQKAWVYAKHQVYLKGGQMVCIMRAPFWSRIKIVDWRS